MSSLLLLTDGPDVTADLLRQAAMGLGFDTRVVELGRDRVTLRIGASVSIECDGEVLAPDVVINRCSANPSGLPSVASLNRQSVGSWSGRFAAAREEQGLLLAVLDAWEALGVTVVNPPAVEARALMDNWFALRMAREGVGLGRRVDETVAVVDGRGAQRPDQETLNLEARRICQLVATVTGARLCEVDLEIADDGACRPVAWRPGVDLLAHGDGAALAGPILAHLLGAVARDVSVVSPDLFVEDLITNLEAPPNG